MRFFLAVLVSLSLFLPLPAPAADQTDLMKKIDDLSKQLDALKQQMQEIRQKETAKDERIAKVEKKTQEATKPSWLQIGGDYRGRFDYLKGTTRDWYSFQQVLPYFLQMPGAKPPQLIPSQDFKNDALMTNRFGINLQAKATEDVTVKARLLMYKVWGHESAEPVAGPSSAFFADKFFIFDGNVSHIPQDNILRVDQAYATWSNIAGAPVWFSLGRRPSTAGVPTNLRQNIEKSGSAGVPGLLIDYAFDGGTIGFAPDIQALPGSYAKICYGKGFDSGFRTTGNSLNDVNFLGINVVPYDTDNFRVELQWDRAFGIFAFPENRNGSGLGFGPNANLGDIDQYGLTVMGKIEKLGPGDLNLFADGAISKTHPNDNFFSVMTPAGAMPVAGLLYDAPNFGGVKEGKTGQALYLGARYDLNKTGTKLGLEYNYGSKNWVAFSPASDDMWTSKLGVHGSVYEAYLIQEIKSKPISKMGKAQFRLGYQYYSFKYTGSNNWVGAPKSMSDLSNPMNAQMFPPLKKANDIYLTFDVTF
ncbi:MAG: DUF3373 domain-containing protein [Nitrospiraceae bacterium]|nr:DUF3373 domain-containing protein [Nitrospiraceae bacterium]